MAWTTPKTFTAGAVLPAADLNTNVRDNSNFLFGLVPTGTLLLYGAAAAPTSFLLCDGSAVSRSTYAALFAVIGTAYGAGDGSTTFNLPDFRGRSPLGAGTGSGLSARSLGAAVGEETHLLTTTEMPSHSHSISDPGHTHRWNADNSGVGGGPGVFGIKNPSLADTGFIENSPTGITGTQAAGSGGSHNNMQPSLVVTVIIKT